MNNHPMNLTNSPQYSRIVTFAERAAQVEPIATSLERIAYRLRQGAIMDTTAADMLHNLAAQLAPETYDSV